MLNDQITRPRSDILRREGHNTFLFQIKSQARLRSAPYAKPLLLQRHDSLLHQIPIKVYKIEVCISQSDRERYRWDQRKNQATLARITKENKKQRSHNQQHVARVNHLRGHDKKKQNRWHPKEEKGFAVIFSSRYEAARF